MLGVIVLAIFLQESVKRTKLLYSSNRPTNANKDACATVA